MYTSKTFPLFPPFTKQIAGQKISTSCTFENPFICGYNHDGWTRTSGDSIANDNGPDKDSSGKILGMHKNDIHTKNIDTKRHISSRGTVYHVSVHQKITRVKHILGCTFDKKNNNSHTNHVFVV